MKYLFILILFASSAQAQIAPPVTDTLRKNDLQKWVSGPAIESFRLVTADTSKCKHIYIAVEQPEVKASFSFFTVDTVVYPPSGKRDGKELVCVKCFHLRKQIIDYGDGSGYYFPNTNIVDTMGVLKARLYKRFAKEDMLIIQPKIRQ